MSKQYLHEPFENLPRFAIRKLIRCVHRRRRMFIGLY